MTKSLEDYPKVAIVDRFGSSSHEFDLGALSEVEVVMAIHAQVSDTYTHPLGSVIKVPQGKLEVMKGSSPVIGDAFRVQEALTIKGRTVLVKGLFTISGYIAEKLESL